MNIRCILFGHRNRIVTRTPYLESHLTELDWQKKLVKYYRSPVECNLYRCERCGSEHKEIRNFQIGNMDNPYIVVMMPDNWSSMPTALKESLNEHPDTGMCKKHNLPIYNLWDVNNPNKCGMCDNE